MKQAGIENLPIVVLRRGFSVILHISWYAQRLHRGGSRNGKKKMKINRHVCRVSLIVFLSIISNLYACGQGLQLSPRDEYDSIPTRPTSKYDSVSRPGYGPGQPEDVQISPSYSSVAPAAQPRMSASRGVAVPDMQVVEDIREESRNADLTGFLPPVGEQIEDGDCVAWAFAYASYSCQICQSRHRADPESHWDIFSPAFVFNQLNANEKGLIPIDAVNLLKRDGCASLVTMPSGNGLPTATAKIEAAAFRAFVHERARGLDDVRAYLDEGFPVVLIVGLDSGFTSLDASTEPYKWSQEKSDNYHAVTAVGYDDQKNAVRIMNSWGTKWKDQGYCWVSYDSLRNIGISHWCAEAHVVKVKAPNPTIAATPETARTDARNFLLKADRRVYEKVAGEYRPLSMETDPKIIDIVCDDSDLFILRHDRKVDIMHDNGSGSDAQYRQWLHLTYGPMVDETASMLAASSDSTLYILTTDGDVIEYHERNSADGELVRINPPIIDQSTTIDLRILGNRLRATTTSGNVFLHDIDNISGQWTNADVQTKK